MLLVALRQQHCTLQNTEPIPTLNPSTAQRKWQEHPAALNAAHAEYFCARDHGKTPGMWVGM